MKELNAVSFKETITSKTPVVVDFWAGWCMPCKIFAPVLEQLSEEMDGTAEFCKLNVDDEQSLAVKYGVESIPTLIVFKDGNEVDRSVGVLKKENVRAMVERHI